MKLVKIYWRDIPAQILVQKGRAKGKAKLPQRFQEAIDRAAMRAGKGSSDLYLAEWRRETEQVMAINDLQAFAEKTASQIATQYDDDLLEKIIKNKGIEPGQD